MAGLSLSADMHLPLCADIHLSFSADIHLNALNSSYDRLYL